MVLRSWRTGTIPYFICMLELIFLVEHLSYKEFKCISPQYSVLVLSQHLSYFRHLFCFYDKQYCCESSSTIIQVVSKHTRLFLESNPHIQQKDKEASTSWVACICNWVIGITYILKWELGKKKCDTLGLYNIFSRLGLFSCIPFVICTKK